MPQKTYRITVREAAARCSLAPSTLRALDRRGVLRPRRDYRGARVYSEADIARLRELAGLDPAECGS
jgi:DNA-binding transcriptional MerR regulator